MTEEAQTTEQSNLSLIASQKFGGNFHGEVEEVPVEEAADQITEEVEAVEEVDQEPEQTQEVEAAAEEEVQQEEYELSHIAQLLGVEENQLDVNEEGGVVLNGKVNGELVKAPVKELLDNYQMFQAADQRLEQAKSQSKAIQQDLAEKTEALNSQFAVAAKLIDNVEGIIGKDEANVNWQQLREDDPAEYSAKKAEFAERRQELSSMKTVAAQEYNNALLEQAEIQKQQYQEYVLAEQGRLLEKIPDWKNEQTANAEKAKLSHYLTKEGFSQEDLSTASDHRLIVLARKAMLYDEGSKKTDISKKKVVKIPKVLKPGTPKPEGQANKELIERHKARLNQTGSINDAFALLQAQKQA